MKLGGPDDLAELHAVLERISARHQEAENERYTSEREAEGKAERERGMRHTVALERIAHGLEKLEYVLQQIRCNGIPGKS